MPSLKIGQTLKILRIASSLSQKDLAKKLGVSQNYLSQLENDRREPSLTFLKTFAEVQDVPLGYLLWLVLDKSDLNEAVDLKGKMDSLLTEIIRGKGNGERKTQ